MVQCLRLRASIAGGTGSIPGQGTKIQHAAWCSQNKRENHTNIPHEIDAKDL